MVGNLKDKMKTFNFGSSQNSPANNPILKVVHD